MKIGFVTYNNKVAGHGTKAPERFGHTFLRGLSYFQGVLHSSSLPDYIEDKKSGGQKTDCLNKNLCNDSTINTGLAGRMIKQMPKTVMRG